MRLVRRVGVAALGLALVAAVVALTAADGMIRSALARAGTAVSGMPTEVSAADLRLRSPAVHITDLRVLNPPAFEAREFLMVDSVKVDGSWGRILRGEREISSVEVHGPCLRLERDGSAGLNLALFSQGMLRHRESTPAGDAPLTLRTVRLTNLRVIGPPLPLLGQRGQLGFVLDSVVVEGVEAGRSGNISRDLMLGVAQAVLLGVTYAGRDRLPEPLPALLESGMVAAQNAREVSMAGSPVRLTRGGC